MTFGERLREEREAAGLSGRALARLAGVSHVTLMRYESGEYCAASDGAMDLAKALGVAVVDLMSSAPRLFEVSMLVESEHAAASMLAAMPTGHARARVNPWPWIGDGHLRVRVRSCALAQVVDELGGAPTVRAVEASESMSVFVRARGANDAVGVVLRETTKSECCPPIEVIRTGDLWLARLRDVPARCSIALQRLTVTAPIGLFVPIHI